VVNQGNSNSKLKPTESLALALALCIFWWVVIWRAQALIYIYIYIYIIKKFVNFKDLKKKNLFFNAKKKIISLVPHIDDIMETTYF